MATTADEWMRQADYDLDTAQFMLDGGRRFYSVFMAHLAVEKALKGIYHQKLKKMPPKTHNLVFLAEESGIVMDDDRRRFLTDLTTAQISTRYPQDMAQLQKEFSESIATEILKSSREVVKWAKTLL